MGEWVDITHETLDNRFDPLYGSREGSNIVLHWPNAYSGNLYMWTGAGMFQNLGITNNPLNLFNCTEAYNFQHLFYGCKNFNDTVDLNKLAHGQYSNYNFSGMMMGCVNFNSPVIFPATNNMIRCSYSAMFSGCENFDQPISQPLRLAREDGAYSMFAGCYQFNQPVTFYIGYSTHHQGLIRTFASCHNFNSPINIVSETGNSIGVCSEIFLQCTNLNTPIHFPYVSSLNWAFGNCQNFNADITIDRVDTHRYTYYPPSGPPVNYNWCLFNNMFYNCRNFDRAFNIPINVTNCEDMFTNCVNFNNNVTIPSTVTNLCNMFAGCKKFNRPAVLPNSAVDVSGMFSGCSNFNQPVTIPNSVTNCYAMFSQCNNQHCQILVPSKFNYNNGVSGWSKNANNCIVWY